MARSGRQIGAAELDVLNVLWDEGPLPVREVMVHLHRRGRSVAYTTVLTFLSRLEQKGHVASDRSGVAYVYRAAIGRERIRRSRLRSLIKQLYDGSAHPLVLQLIEHEKFTPEEIGELQALVNRLDAETRQSAGGKKKPRRPSRGERTGESDA